MEHVEPLLEPPFEHDSVGAEVLVHVDEVCETPPHVYETIDPGLLHVLPDSVHAEEGHL